MNGNRSTGHPVDIATGIVFVTRREIWIPGMFPLTWEPHYSTALLNEPASWFGPGWTTRYFATLTCLDGQYRFHSPKGASAVFLDPQDVVAQGGLVRDLATCQELSKDRDRFVITRWDVETKDVERFVFREGKPGVPWQLASIEDLTGQGLDLVRDGAARIVEIRQRLEGRALHLEYTSAGLIKMVDLRSPKGKHYVLRRYEYDANGRLGACRDVLDYVDRYEYDASGRIIREIVRDGGVFSFQYDAEGRCIRTAGVNRFDEKTLRYRDKIGWTEVTDSLENTSRYQWRADGQIVTEQDATGRVLKTEYDDLGRIIAKIDGAGGRVAYTYDEQGNRCRTEDPLGHASTFTFNAAHLPVTWVDPRGETWRRFYDQKHRLIASEDPLGHRYAFIPDELGRLVHVFDPLGNQFDQTFSAGGDKVELTDGKGRTVCRFYDEMGRLIEHRDATGSAMTYRYDQRGHLIEISYPDRTQTLGQWDAAGNLVEYRDRTGRVTRYRFGSCGRLLEKREPSGNFFRYSWSTEPGRLLSATNSAGETYHYEYDASGRLIKEIGFDGRLIKREYDAGGWVNAIVNGAGLRTEYKRDPLGRLLGQTLPDGSVTSFTYDPMGEFLTAVNDQAEVAFERDKRGRPIVERQAGFSLRRMYDALDRVLKVEMDGAPTISNEWDHVGHPSAVIAGEKSRWEFLRNLRGDEEKRRLPGQIELTQSFDAGGQLLVQELSPRGGPLRVRRANKYDGPVVQSVSDRSQGTIAYDYDAGERLVAVRRDHGLAETYAYDANDRLTLSRHGDVQERLTYDGGGRLIARGDIHHEYDADGRLVRRYRVGEDGSWHFIWNGVGQLRDVVAPDNRRWTYSYDAFSRLVARKGPDVDAKYVWNGDTILHEFASNRLANTWVFDPEKVFEPLGVLRGGRPFSLVSDRAGTPYLMVDESGKAVWSVRHLAWGKADALVGEVADCPIRFPGQWYLPETGLHYNQYRHYDPESGQYISQDPAGRTGTRGLYAYGLNPLRWVDPYGLIDEFVGDSNLFQDRPGAPGTRAIADTILADPTNKILIPAPTADEALRNDKFGTQAPRLNGSPATVTQTPALPEPSPMPPGMISKAFGPEDLQLCLLAQQKGLPIVTTNAAMKNQVAARFPGLKVLVVGEDIKDNKDLKTCPS